MQASFAGWRRNCELPRAPEIPARSSGCGNHVDDDPATVRLSAAQLVVAREHGFASWPRLMEHLEARRSG